MRDEANRAVRPVERTCLINKTQKKLLRIICNCFVGFSLTRFYQQIPGFKYNQKKMRESLF